MGVISPGCSLATSLLAQKPRGGAWALISGRSVGSSPPCRVHWSAPHPHPATGWLLSLLCSCFSLPCPVVVIARCSVPVVSYFFRVYRFTGVCGLRVIPFSSTRTFFVCLFLTSGLHPRSREKSINTEAAGTAEGFGSCISSDACVLLVRGLCDGAALSRRRESGLGCR